MKKILLICLLLAGCSAAKKEQREIAKQHLLNYQHPNSLAEDCAKTFPVKDSIGKIVFINANNVDLTNKVDSLQYLLDNVKAATKPVVINGKVQPFDSVKYLAVFNNLQNKYNALKEAYKSFKPDTVKTPIHYIVDNALVTLWKSKYQIKADSLIKVKTQSDTTISDLKKGKNIWMWIAICTSLIIIVTIVIKVVSFFYGGAIVKGINKVI